MDHGDRRTPGDVLVSFVQSALHRRASRLSQRVTKTRAASRWAAALKRTLACGAVIAATVVAAAPERTRAAGEVRTLSFFNIHTNETTTIEFKRDGQWVPGALDKFNYAMRDWRKNEVIKMDPALLDLMWEIYTELGSKKPINLICGHRSRDTNEMLRASVGGQAQQSQHITGRAADVQFPDIPLTALRYSALIRERGGVGFYPTSAIQFVHIDTGNVRHWPRLPRYELALLFPNGKSQHQPADGRPITPDDVRVAKTEHRTLAMQVANLFDSRAGRRPPIALAGLDGAKSGTWADAPSQAQPGGIQLASYQPQLLEAPRIVDRPSRFAVPSASEQAHMTDLIQRASFVPEKAAPAPRLVAAPVPAVRPRTAPPDQMAALVPAPPILPPELPPLPLRDEPTFVAAPDFDEDHPDEMSYRPFPIAPLLTTTASADDPVLAKLTHPDFARTFEMLDQAGAMPPMHLRPSLKVAEMLWTQQFSGEAANFSAMQEATAGAPGLTSRKVHTR